RAAGPGDRQGRAVPLYRGAAQEVAAGQGQREGGAALGKRGRVDAGNDGRGDVHDLGLGIRVADGEVAVTDVNGGEDVRREVAEAAGGQRRRGERGHAAAEGAAADRGRPVQEQDRARGRPEARDGGADRGRERERLAGERGVGGRGKGGDAGVLVD